MKDSHILAAVGVVLAAQELDQMKAMQLLPEPALLLERMRARTNDFNLLAGVTAAYLRLIDGGPNA
jgi:hypothetical protein